MAKYLDNNGVLYLWNKIRAKFVVQESGKGLSTNDFTTTEKNKLSGIATGATKTVVDSTISPSSTNPVQNKVIYNALLGKVDIDDIDDMQSQINSAVHTANDAYNALSNYALKSDITNTYKYKGSVTNSSNLPTSGQAVGDTYNIVNASTYGPAGTNVAWDGSKWDALGGLFEIESITNAELDEICV